MTEHVQDRKRRHTDPISLLEQEDQALLLDETGKILKYLDLADQMFSTDMESGDDGSPIGPKRPSNLSPAIILPKGRSTLARHHRPEGTLDLSPALQRWVGGKTKQCASRRDD